jgi:hypothetical protein
LLKQLTSFSLIGLLLLVQSNSFALQRSSNKRNDKNQSNQTNNNSIKSTKGRIVLDVDLSKGNAGSGVVSGGKFVEQGWTPESRTDNITWTMNPFVPIKKGYFSIELTNLNPFKQAIYDKSQFLTFIDNEEAAVANSVVMRMSKGFKPFNIEVKEREGTDDDWREWLVTIDEKRFDTSQTHTLTIEWDSSPEIRVIFDGNQYFKHPNNRTLAPVYLKGLYQLIIGDNWTKGAFPGPIYKRVTCVSLDEEPVPSLNKSVAKKSGGNGKAAWQTVSLQSSADSSAQDNQKPLKVTRVEASNELELWPSPRYTALNAVDGKELNTRWLAKSAPQWIKFDLGEIKNIKRISASFDRYKKLSYLYTISVSKDNKTWIDLIKDARSEKKQWTDISFPTTEAKFIKLTCRPEDTSSNMVGLWEIQFWGE